MIIQQLLENSGHESELDYLRETIELLEIAGTYDPTGKIGEALAMLAARRRELQPTLKPYKAD